MTCGTILKRAGLCAALMLLLDSRVAAGQWARVAIAGLDDSSQREVSGLAVFGSEVYLATHRADGTPRVFRAPVRDDGFWEDVTPSGMTGIIQSIGVVSDGLLVSTEGDASHAIGGQLWTRDRAGVWANITPSPTGWGAPRAFLFATGWTPRRGGRILCVARAGLQVWCKDNLLPWTNLPLPGSLGADASIGSARLQAYDDRLYLGLGGLTDGSRGCEAWDYDFRLGRWQAVSTNCFGHPTDTWLLSMEVFEGRLYFGTGGASLGALAGIYRTNGRTLEDVTPCYLWVSCTGFSTDPSPVRFQVFARAGTQLYSGIRGGSAPGSTGSGYVLSTGDGTAWAFGSERGFTVLCNDEVTALGSSRAYLYAGTYNGCTGFEVWRRTPTLRELRSYLVADGFTFLRHALTIRACLLSPRACDFEPIMGPIEAMSLAFDAAKDPKDDQALIKSGRANMSEVSSLIAQARKLVDAAGQTQDAKETKRLRREAVGRLSDAMQLVWTTVVSIGDQLKEGR